MSASENLDNTLERIKRITDPIGLEAYPFKIEWYNSTVKTAFQLEYDPDIIAFAILSVPDMFEKCLLPFIEEKKFDFSSSRDPLDQCMAECFNKIKEEFPEYNIKAIHDFEVHPSRRPKILVQTVGHVSGAAYYYQKEELKDLESKEKLFGVSIHPKYGGWFAFRGILIFENLKFPGLVKKDPEDVIKSDVKKLELLKRFNYNWKDWSYRDIIKPVAKYSEMQKEFFMTPPAQRQELIKRFAEK